MSALWSIYLPEPHTLSTMKSECHLRTPADVNGWRTMSHDLQIECLRLRQVNLSDQESELR